MSAGAVQGAIDFYVARVGRRDELAAEPEVLERWTVGALGSFSGVVGNGGLVGTVEGSLEGVLTGQVPPGDADDGPAYLTDAVLALRGVGLDEAAALVERATAEYLRMRPHGSIDEISPADEALWEELDAAFDLWADEVDRIVEERAAALG